MEKFKKALALILALIAALSFAAPAFAEEAVEAVASFEAPAEPDLETNAVRFDVVSIEVYSIPNRTVYELGENVDLTGLKIKEYYSDGTYAIKEEGYLTSIPAYTTPGRYKVKVSGGGGFETYFYLTIVEKGELSSIQSISIKKLPDKIEYNQGEKINVEGLVVVANYKDGTVKEISYYTYWYPNTSTAGVKKVRITYAYFETSFNITVNGPVAPTISSVSIKTLPDKTVYTVGEGLSFTGLALYANYTDGTRKTVTSGYTYTAPDMTTTGTKTVKIHYAGFTASYNITVNAKPVVTLVSIAVTRLPDKTVYFVGEKVNCNGFQVTGTYSDGSKKVIPTVDVVLPDTSTTGTKTVTVKYGGKQTTFNITVRAPYVNATSVDVYVEKDFENMVAQLSYKVNPSNADIKSVSWKSSDTSICTVDSDGTVTAKPKNGEAIVTVTLINYDGTTVSADMKITNSGYNSNNSGGIFGAIINFFRLILEILLFPILIFF